MDVLHSVLITGANAGLGKETARQLALQDGIEKIYLGCRNESRALEAKKSLEESTGKSIFEIVLMDVSSPESVRAAVASLDEPVDALVMNAGGMGGKEPEAHTSDGVMRLVAVNVLGHVVLLDELMAAGKLTKVAIYAGSEAARGVPKMGIKRPVLATSSVDDFAAICDGSYFGDKKVDPMVAYAQVKYLAAMWMASVARKHPELRIVTVSPGGTSGTNIADDLNPFMRLLFKVFGSSVMPLFGLMHSVDAGAKRYVDVLNDDSFRSGVFYASKAPTLTGEVVDQSTIFPDLSNPRFQDNANEAVHRFIA